jgi:phage-related tail fiber protein
MSDFFSEWTAAGLAKLRAALHGGPAVSIKQLALGDGGGAAVDPTGRAALVREVYRADAIVSVVPNHALMIQVVITVPPTVGGWTVREVAVIDADGVIVAIGSLPVTLKANDTSGSPNEFIVKVMLAVSNAATVVVTIDQSAINATQAFVIASIAQHGQQQNPHPVYLLRSDAVAQYAALGHGHQIAGVAGLQDALTAMQNNINNTAAQTDRRWVLRRVYFQG